jgi:hypothetical protein
MLVILVALTSTTKLKRTSLVTFAEAMLIKLNPKQFNDVQSKSNKPEEVE